MDRGEERRTEAEAPTRRQALVGVATAVATLALGARRAAPSGGDEISRTEEAIHQEVVFQAPRRRVYDVALDRLHVEQPKVKRGLRVRLWSRDHRPLLLDLRTSAQNAAFVEALAARTAPPGEP